MISRYFFSVSVIFLASVMLLACSENSKTISADTYADQGTTYAQARQTQTATLRVLYVPAPGFAVEADGEMQGVGIDILYDFQRWFERYHSISLQFEFIPEEDWSVFYQRIVDAEGGVFGLGNVTITEQRRDELAFSPPYLNNVAVLITAAQYPEFTTVESMADHIDTLRPLAFSSTLHQTRVEELRDQIQPDATLTEVTTNQAVLDEVSENNFYSYIDAYNYHRAAEQGASIKHHPAFSLSGEQFGIIMPHSNDWQMMLTAFFAAEGGYLTTERYRTILRTHLGEQVTEILLETQ